MYFWIPGELIAFLTFPGVIVHEIAHRFFCDIFNIPVYEIHYFEPFSRTAGHVRHHPTDNLRASFLIGIAPLIINSLLCMILTFPKGMTFFLGTSFFSSASPMQYILGIILYWIGFSIGFNAIPSKQDLSGLTKMTDSYFSKTLLFLVYGLLWPFNTNGIGPLFCLVYAYLLSLVLPFILFG